MAPLLVWQEDHGRNSLAWLEPGDCRVARVGAKFFKTPLPVFKVAVSGQADTEKSRSLVRALLSPPAAAGSKARTVGLALGSASLTMQILSVISSYEIINEINLLIHIGRYAKGRCDAALQYPISSYGIRYR
jgi:hypothetical protein